MPMLIRKIHRQCTGWSTDGSGRLRQCDGKNQSNPGDHRALINDDVCMLMSEDDADQDDEEWFGGLEM